MSEREIPLLILGCGPAGLTAAAEAGALGIETVVLDMYARPGGQYYKLPSAEFRQPHPSRVEAEGLRLIEAAQRAGVEIWSDTVVWGVYAETPFRVCYTRGVAACLRARQIIFATGAYDRPQPFPGWTLPGVMTAGGVLALLKSQRVVPGRRFLLAGSGPLQLSLAAHLIAAGAQIEAVLEARSLASFVGAWRHLGMLLGQGGRLREGLDYWNALRHAGAPLRFGCTIARADGDKRVERAVIMRVDKRGRPLTGSEKTAAVDTICLGYGFWPSDQAPRLLNCEQRLDESLSARVTLRDAWMQTSVPGAFVAGDAAGIGGKETALLEGRLAALGVAQRAGVLSPTQAEARARPLRASLKRERRFAEFLRAYFGPLPGLWELVSDDTVLCRCENVTLGQVKRALADGAETLADVKAQTRLGMGRCAGRVCNGLAAQVIANVIDRPLEWAGRCSVRPPIFPVSLGELESLGAASTTPGLHFD